jgi:hypothetical protein
VDYLAFQNLVNKVLVSIGDCYRIAVELIGGSLIPVERDAPEVVDRFE